MWSVERSIHYACATCNIMFFLEGIHSNLQIMTQRIIETLSYALTHTVCFRCYTVSRD